MRATAWCGKSLWSPVGQKTCQRFLLASLGAALLAGCVITRMAGVITNVPHERLNLSANEYVGKNGEFVAQLPRLVRPGTRIQEVQSSPDAHVVAFADDFGTTYVVMVTNNRERQFTLDQIASEFSVGDFLLSKETVETSRGAELRLAGIRKEGSPIVTRSRSGKERDWVERPNDLVAAQSIFLRGDYIYDITAGVTFIGSEKDFSVDAQIGLAKQNLEAFLAGITFR